MASRIVASPAIILLIDSQRMVVGERIRSRLKVVGLSQSELARRVGVSQPMVNSLIRGATRSTTQLHVIARELRTTPAYLNGEVDDPDRDAPEPPTLSREQSEWLAVFEALDAPNRAALMQIGRTMVTGMSRPTVNAPRLFEKGEVE